jgi:hypothetical protein
VTRTTCLARVACYGSVSTSPSGRLRVRYGNLRVKLRPHEYALFAAEIRARADRGGSLEMRYGRETLRLRPAELRRFAQMIQEGWSRLMDMQFARLVATGVSPEATEPGVDSLG